MHRVLRAMAAALLALPAFASLGNAQSEEEARARVESLKPADFPTQSIEINVAYPAGGGMDLNARLIATAFEEVTGATTLVNNRTGGAGLVGHSYLASQAESDGYTVGVIASLVFADAFLRAQGRWDMEDLEPIAYLNSEGLNVVVNASGPFANKSFAEIVEMAAAEPGTVRVTSLPGSIFEYVIEQVEEETGASFLKVPFQGGAPGITSLLGDNVDVGLGFYGEVRSHLDGGTLRPVAVSSAERSPFLPDAPTLNEALGTDDLVWSVARWVVVPEGTPEDRKAYLSAGFVAAAADPDLQEEFRALGSVPDTSYDSAEKVEAHIAELAELQRAFFVSSGRLQ